MRVAYKNCWRRSSQRCQNRRKRHALKSGERPKGKECLSKNLKTILLLLSKFLGLSKRQQESIASELRDHMEHRLDDLQSQGVSREEAIRTALDEFGDASILAHRLSNVARDRKRRWMMRLTTGSLAAAVMTVVATMAFWPDDSHNSAFAPANAHADETVGAEGDVAGDVADSRSDAISFSNDSLDESAAAIRKHLERKCDIHFVDSSLADVAEFTRKVIEKPVVLDGHALDELAIGSDTMVPDTELAQVSLKSGLQRVLGALGLSTMIENESLVITTRDRSQGSLTTRFYPVWDLVKPLAKKASETAPEVHSAFRPPRTAADFDTLIDIVISNIAPDTWDDVGGEGSIQAYKGMLVVSNTDDVHKQIEHLVRQLRRFPLYSDELNPGDALTIAVGEAAARIEKRLRQKQSIQFDESSLDDSICGPQGEN